MFLGFLLTLFLSSADNCSCPVVQCDPCQKSIVLETQKIQCEPNKSVVCKNIVCENVDNYFQCIAGSRPQHVPPEEALTRTTDPKWVETPSVISTENFNSEFKHFNHNIEIKASPEEVLAPKPLRDLASTKNQKLEKNKPEPVFKETPLSPLILRGKISASVDGRSLKFLKVLKLESPEGTIKFPNKQMFWMDYSGASAHWKVESGTELRFEKEGSHLAIHLLKGKLLVDSIAASDLLVFDVGLWRVGKGEGSLALELRGNDLVINNKVGKALLRRDQLIAKSEWLDEGIELLVSHDFGIVHSDKALESKDIKLQLTEPEEKKGRRILASSSIDQAGCADPVGGHQQCAWKCFGAKNKSKSCENSETTQCVRFTCSLGGEWKTPTRVSGKECKAHSVVVDSCQ